MVRQENMGLYPLLGKSIDILRDSANNFVVTVMEEYIRGAHSHVRDFDLCLYRKLSVISA